jgi:nitroreductase
MPDCMRTRRTINDFRPEVPSQDLVLKAIELARWAPNHKLTEPWHFTLIGPQTSRQIIDLNTRLTREEKGEAAAQQREAKWSATPGWLLVTSEKSVDPLREEENYAAVCCAIQNLTLYLWSEGIGAKWITGPITRNPDFARLVNVDFQTRKVVGLIWYGYPAAQPSMKRRPVSEITQILP